MRNFDYRTPGGYFITICTHEKNPTFDDLRHAAVVRSVWEELPSHYTSIELDAFVIMPNHVHGIIFIEELEEERTRAGWKPAPTAGHPLSEIVRGFKTFSARRINGLRGTPRTPVWQRNYYEHVIRSSGALDRIRRYIVDNPARWRFDPENPGGDADPEETEFWNNLR